MPFCPDGANETGYFVVDGKVIGVVGDAEVEQAARKSEGDENFLASTVFWTQAGAEEEAARQRGEVT